jgi:Flp pilus assembly protein TadG
LCRDRGATTALEFAFVAPVFIVMLLMVFEFGFQLAVDLALNFGTTSAARYASTGAVTGTVGTNGSNGTNDAAIRSVIVSSTGGWLNPSRFVISATSYGNPANYVAGTGGASGSNGSSGSVVVYSITYNQPFLTGLPALVARLASPSPIGTSIAHHTTVVVQNEPY